MKFTQTIQTTENWGFEKNYLNDLKLEFGKPLNDWVIQNVLFKVLFPAEFHGQSAVECAIGLSKEFNNNKEKIKQIKIFTHEPAIIELLQIKNNYKMHQTGTTALNIWLPLLCYLVI